MMAKQYHFDDEDELEEDYSSSYLDELENKKEGAPYISIDEEDDKEDEPMKKKKKKICMEMVALFIDFIWCFSNCVYCLYSSFIIA